jgi:WD40 repeat protein
VAGCGREHADAEPQLRHAHQGVVAGVAVSSDGQWVVSAGKDGTIPVWDRRASNAEPTPGNSEKCQKRKWSRNNSFVADAGCQSVRGIAAVTHIPMSL